MIRVFGRTDTEFSSNGDKIIQPYKAVVRCEDNGDFYLDLECGIEYSSYIAEGRIIVAPVIGDTEQPFRITNPKTVGRKIKCKAYHPFYDGRRYIVEDSELENVEITAAMEAMNDSIPASPFTLLPSDILSEKSYSVKLQNITDGFFQLAELYEGHLIRDGFSVGIVSSLGADRGVTVHYGKDLQSIEIEERWNDVVTNLYAVGKDSDITAHIQVEDINGLKYTKYKHFSQSEVVKTDDMTEEQYHEALQADIEEKALAWIDAHKVPEITYTVKASPEGIRSIGDTVEVVDERLGLTLITKVSAYEFDCIKKRITLLQFGNAAKTAKQSVNSAIAQATEQIQAQVNEQQAEIDKLEVRNLMFWGTARISYWRELKKHTWGELNGIHN